MVTYIFRSLGNQFHLEGELAVSVHAALSEIQCQGAFRYERVDTTETSVASDYVLMCIAGAAGWHHHQTSVFSRHGVTCASFPTARRAGTC